MNDRSLLRSTLYALLVPRRLIPIVLLCVPLLLAQSAFSTDPLAVPLGIVMCLAFVLLGPVSWRALFPVGEPVGRPFGRVVVYGVAGAGTVLLLGSAVPRLLGIGQTLLTTDAGLLVQCALFGVGGYGLGREIDMERSLERERARADALAVEAERARLLALRSHLDPHFLFNTLNAIAEWCREDGETAERATLMLSGMLRNVLAGTRLRSWPIAQELALADMLLELHLVRDPQAFALKREYQDPLPSVEVPPMVLLPLVENAVKHGPADGHRGEIRLRLQPTEEGAMAFEVENPGAFSDDHRGEGLAMVRKRLALAYGGLAHMDIRDVGERTRARVMFPGNLSCPEVIA